MTAEKPEILIADDDLDLLEVLGDVLLGAGYAPTAVRSEQAVLDALDRQIFQAVVIDAFSNPGRNTLATLDAIVRKAQPTPVGVLSGRKISEAEVAAHGLRFALLKPFDIAQLIGEVARMLGGPLDPAQSEACRIAQRYFAALESQDWDALVALCAEEVRFSGPKQLRFAATVQGRPALRKHSKETFATFADAKFRDLFVYATPDGIAVRYLSTWTKAGVQQQQTGTALFHIRDGLIQRIGIEMNETLLDRLTPA